MEEKLMDLEGSVYVQSESKDGRYAFFSFQDSKTGFDIYVMDLAGDRKLVPVLNSAYAERDPKLSPNNKWLAYSSNENGAVQLYVTPFPVSGSKWQVSTGGLASSKKAGDVTVADWSADGKSLYFREGDKVLRVEMHVGGGNPQFSAPKEIMSIPHDVDFISIMADGKRTLATRPVGEHRASPMGLVLNWQRMLQ